MRPLTQPQPAPEKLGWGDTGRRDLGPTPRPPRLSRGWVIAILYSGLGVIAVGWSALRGDWDVYRTSVSTPTRMLWGPLVGVAVGGVVVVLCRLAVRYTLWARVLHREFHAVVHELSAREVFLLAVSSSVGEELFFRGALVPHVGVLLSSVLFAMLHFRLDRRFWPWTAMSFGVGVVLALMYSRLGDLGGPMAAHFVINFFNLRYIRKSELPA